MDQKRHWRILEKHWETPTAVTLTLEPLDLQPISYTPGQYLPLIRQINGQEERRAYSFSSCPGLDNRPKITVKRVSNGVFSKWLVQDSRPGDQLLSGKPAGRFLLPEQPPGHLIFVAAGSGITPIMSQLKFLLELGNFADTPIALFYANRDSANTIFKKQIDTWIAQFPGRFSCTYFFSQVKSAPNALHRHLGNALFESELLKQLGGNVNQQIRAHTQVYLCAPLALMRMAKMTLRVLDFPEENIHQETFVPKIRHQQRTIDKSKTHHIVATNPEGERLEFNVFGGETILDGALRQGIALPYTCKTGVCLTCLARCVRGYVDVHFVEQIQREGPGALVNTCIGYPATEAVVLAYE